MIQSHLLPAQPPYQIICAGGEIGIQVATLVVVEDDSDYTGGYGIKTHSHPVVNYGLKDNLPELYKKDKNRAEFLSMWQLQPECAVWDKIEISDIEVLGLAGLTQSISLEECLAIVPARNNKYNVRIWSDYSVMTLNHIPEKLRHFGIGISQAEIMQQDEVVLSIWPAHDDDEKTVIVCLGFEDMDLFALPLYDEFHKNSIDTCAKSIVSVLSMIILHFVQLMTPVKLVMEPNEELGITRSKIEPDVKKVVEMVNKQITYKP